MRLSHSCCRWPALWPLPKQPPPYVRERGTTVRLYARTFLGLEFANDGDGTKDLFPDDLHVRLALREDGRLNEISLRPVSVASVLHLGTFALSGLNVSENFLGGGDSE